MSSAGPKKKASKRLGRRALTQDVLMEHALVQLTTNFKRNKRGCKVWEGNVFSNGYGRLSGKMPEGLSGRPHVAAMQLKYGGVPDGFMVCHTCDNRLCYEENHLWFGTNQENQLDARAKGGWVKYWTPERREEKRRAMQGDGNPAYGKPGTCIGRTGAKHPMFGKKHTEEAKKKISLGLKKARLEGRR